MKKLLTLLLVIALCLLGGCAPKSDEQNTLTLTVPYGRVDALLAAAQEKFPDIHFELNYYVGDNTSMYLSNQIRHGDAGDLIFYTTFTSMEADTSQMLDLSGYSFVGNISDNILALINTDDHIYQIPGPLDVRCIVYNKTMFEEHGWKVPTNFEEQLALIRQIRAEAPEIIPISMGFLPGYSFVLPMTLSQASGLSTSEGYAWEQRFFRGESSFGEGVADGLTQVEQLVAADAFTPEPFLNTSQCNDAMLNGEIAMYYCWSGLRNFFSAEEASDCTDEFGLLPFFGLRDGDMVVGYNGSSMWSLNKRLGESGNEKKRENALKFMEWIVSAEGQELGRKSRGQVPVTKDLTDYDPRIDELMTLALNGYKAYGAYTGYEHLMVETGIIIQDAIVARNADGMRETVVRVADELNAGYAKDGSLLSYYAVLKENLNEEQTAQLMANMLFDSGMGDIALITHTGVKGGEVNKTGAGGSLYAGPISDQHVLIINADREYRVTTIEMTGAEVKALLQSGKTMGEQAFEYHWSGLDVAQLDGAASYTVVFSQNDYPEAFAERAVVSERLVSDVMIEYMTKHPEISAPEVPGK